MSECIKLHQYTHVSLILLIMVPEMTIQIYAIRSGYKDQKVIFLVKKYDL